MLVKQLLGVRRHRLWTALVVGLVVIGLVACPRPRRRRAKPAPVDETEPTSFSPPTVCANCHVGISVQYYRSMHAQSLSNPVFRAHYYREYMPVFHESPKEYLDEPACLRCHGPVAYMEFFEKAKQRMATIDNATDCLGCHNETRIEKTLAAPGVICDVCHRIEGYDGDQPGGGNYIAKPGRLKFGPFDYEQDFHRQYNELQTRSEICGICHNSFNRYGLEVRSTYSEWKQSRFAEQGIQCQDCHMNARGFLMGGKAVFEAGKAAFMTVGEAPQRDKLFTHRFFGAHSESQIDGALSVEIVAPEKVSTGDDLPIKVRVHNEKTGHKMPTGSVELRAVWLDVTVYRQSDYDEEIDFEIVLKGDREGYAVSGTDGDDARILGDEVPRGKRVYRAVFIDEQGRQTMMSYDAKERVFDNRLAAGEVREESYMLSVPAELRGWITVEAKLYYLRYPEAFAKRLRIRPVESIPFATGTMEILIRN